MHFCLKIWHLVTRILVIFLRINRPSWSSIRPKSRQKCSTIWSLCSWDWVMIVLNTVNQWLLLLVNSDYRMSFSLCTVGTTILWYFMLLQHEKNIFKDSSQSTVDSCESSKYICFGLHNFVTWTAHSALWMTQSWLHSTVRICSELTWRSPVLPVVLEPESIGWTNSPELVPDDRLEQSSWTSGRRF